MRLRRLPKNFYYIASSGLPELPESARLRLAKLRVINQLRSGFSVARACGMVGVSRATYYRWSALLRQGPAELGDGRANNKRRRRAPVREAHWGVLGLVETRFSRGLP